MVKTLRTTRIISGLASCRQILRLDTQRVRAQLVRKLGGIFNDANALAHAKELQPKERVGWARVAAYVAQTIDGLCSGFDERQIDTDLAELQRLINEAKAKVQNENLQTGTLLDWQDSNSTGSS